MMFSKKEGHANKHLTHAPFFLLQPVNCCIIKKNHYSSERKSVVQESRFYRFIKPLIPRTLRPLCLKYQEYISYLVFGVLTTLVNLIIFYVLERLINYLMANVIAWIGAVVFAYVVNKLFVFESDRRDIRGLLFEISTFFAARLLSLGLEEGILFLFVTQLGYGARIVKLFAQILVVIFNYLASKLVTFRK